MTFNNRKYSNLLTRTLPRVIDSQAEYDRVEENFNDMMNKGEERLSPEESALLALLANLLEDYERRNLAPLKESAPLEALNFLMAENNLKQKDIVDCFGSQGIASEVLAGKREISKAQAKYLAERFKVSPALFI